MRFTKYALTTLVSLVFVLSTSSFGKGDVEQLLLGDHLLTLQWLQNSNGIGKAKIFKRDGKILIDGYQEEKYEGELNYMIIKGELKIISEKDLDFEGTITTRISYINEGKPYERKGTFHLKAWGTRKYWRMQNMTQPDGNSSVMDYIDIFFEKFKSK